MIVCARSSYGTRMTRMRQMAADYQNRFNFHLLCLRGRSEESLRAARAFRGCFDFAQNDREGDFLTGSEVPCLLSLLH